MKCKKAGVVLALQEVLRELVLRALLTLFQNNKSQLQNIEMFVPTCFAGLSTFLYELYAVLLELHERLEQCAVEVRHV